MTYLCPTLLPAASCCLCCYASSSLLPQYVTIQFHSIHTSHFTLYTPPHPLPRRHYHPYCLPSTSGQSLTSSKYYLIGEGAAGSYFIFCINSYAFNTLMSVMNLFEVFSLMVAFMLCPVVESNTTPFNFDSNGILLYHSTFLGSTHLVLLH